MTIFLLITLKTQGGCTYVMVSAKIWIQWFMFGKHLAQSRRHSKFETQFRIREIATSTRFEPKNPLQFKDQHSIDLARWLTHLLVLVGLWQYWAYCTHYHTLPPVLKFLFGAFSRDLKWDSSIHSTAQHGLLFCWVLL